MAQFFAASLQKLGTCHPDLQRVMMEVVKYEDAIVLEGFRDEAAQEAAFAAGNSTKHWPDGNHNKMPSDAVDVAPFPIDWDDRVRFGRFAGRVLQIADQLGVKLRWGGDWNMNGKTTDQKLSDLPHFERV